MADEVVAGGEALRDRAGPLLVASHELGDAPARGVLAVEEDGDAVAAEAGLVNLEPALAGAVAAAEGARALVHPHEDGALGVRPLLPDGRDLVAGGGRGELSGRAAAVATQLSGRAGRDGVVVGPLPLDHVRGVAGRESLVAKTSCQNNGGLIRV